MKAERTDTVGLRLPIPALALHPTTRARLSALCLGLAVCARASATVTPTVIDTYPDWDGNVTQSYLKVAQSFLAPTDSTLARWKFTLAPIAQPTNVLFQIVRWNPNSGPSGAPLFSRQLNWPALDGDVLVDNINLTLTPTSVYAAVVGLEGYRGKSVYFQFNQDSYDQGNASWFGGSSWIYLHSTYNTEFRAEFYPIPEPANVLGLGLAGYRPSTICKAKEDDEKVPLLVLRRKSNCGCLPVADHSAFFVATEHNWNHLHSCFGYFRCNSCFTRG